MKDYQTAISHSQKALEIQKNCLAIDHPDLAISYINMAITYRLTGDYLTSLLYLEDAFAIQQ
jgi:tetratricopeptide (TPR) repeat protein